MPTVAPKYPLDYLFMLAYPIAFIGAILFSINSFFTIQPISTIVNNNVQLVLFVYISTCGFLGFLMWLEPLNIPILDEFMDLLSKNAYNLNSIVIESTK
jgi:hypothetical protein